NRPVNLQACQLSGDCILHPEQVVVGTINDLKGFEFRLILIIGCDAKSFPESGVPHDEVWRDALRLYVAMTRGRDQVYLLHGESASEFIPVFGDTVVFREELGFKPYDRASQVQQTIAQQKPQPPINTVQHLPKPGIDWGENCEKWFNSEEIDALNRYFAIHVYRENLTFHEWMIPRNLQRLNERALYNLKHVRRKTANHIMSKLHNKGITS
ncbi:MAG TPA: hypothetical protein VK811_05400, partial [Candidatus Acidoferrum sp.]|nr:hypothetical protein [Candidatus Acidoferrum sp.]